MTLDAGLAAIGALGIAVVLNSRRIRRLPVTEPLAALVLGAVLGPEVAGVIELTEATTVLHTVSEVVIAVALMAIALRFPWSVVQTNGRRLAVMLLFVMPAMAVVVALLGIWVLGLGFGAAVLLGSILAPTDPVLSASIVTGEPAVKALPEPLRAGLSLESGANDGLALPLVVVGLSLVHSNGPERLLLEGVLAVGVAIAIGWMIGRVTGRLFQALDETRQIESSAFFVFTVVLALFTLGATNLVGGDGILGVFVAGLAYNRTVGQRIYDTEREVEEGVSRVLVLPVFVLFGAVLPWDEWFDLGWSGMAFVAGVLLFRRLPIVVALGPVLKLGWRQLVFLGWFGPMGAAALFFVTLALEENTEIPELWPAVALVVAASTIVHGVTAAPGRRLYERSAAPRGE